MIGTGASSTQILPHLAESAQHVYLFQRTPGTVNARNNQPTDPDWFHNLEPGWQQKRMDNFVEMMSGRPVDVDLINDEATDMGRRMSAAMNGPDGVPDFATMQAIDFEKMEEIRRRVTEIVRDPDTAKSLQPWYDYFCKRPLFSDDYYPAFNNDNVTLVDTDGRGVDHITERGVVFDGVEYDVDLIIYSTGFDAIAYTHKAGGYELTGRDGVADRLHLRHPGLGHHPRRPRHQHHEGIGEPGAPRTSRGPEILKKFKESERQRKRMMTMLNADDRWEISETLSLHGHIFDGGHLDRLEEIFAPEVVYDLSDAGVGTFEGIEAIRSATLKLGAANPIAHHLTNVVIADEENGLVTVQSKGLMIMANGTIGSVNHLDTLRRHNGRWRISRRVITAQRTPSYGPAR